MTRLITWNRANAYLEAFGAFIPCSCNVRTLQEGTRGKHEIVYSTPGELPYDPRRFPLGKWTVYQPRKRTDPYRAPWYIPTDAWQMVDVWEVQNGFYVQPTDQQTRDEAYGLHFSNGPNTFGCIKILSKDELIWIAEKIFAYLKAEDTVEIEVTE
jgi:hypothetical protein